MEKYKFFRNDRKAVNSRFRKKTIHGAFMREFTIANGNQFTFFLLRRKSVVYLPILPITDDKSFCIAIQAARAAS